MENIFVRKVNKRAIDKIEELDVNNAEHKILVINQKNFDNNSDQEFRTRKLCFSQTLDNLNGLNDDQEIVSVINYFLNPCYNIFWIKVDVTRKCMNITRNWMITTRHWINAT